MQVRLSLKDILRSEGRKEKEGLFFGPLRAMTNKNTRFVTLLQE